MKQQSSPQSILGGSIFWILVILVSLAGLIYLGIWAYHNNNVQAIAILSIFGIMILSGVILSRFEIFNSGTWTQNSFWFLIGFALYAFLLSSGSKSVLSLTQNGLFASISSQLPLELEFTFNTYIIPIAEEIFWMIGIPYSVNSILELIGIKFAPAKNIFVKLIIIGAISAVTFAYFHVAKVFFLFLIGAMIFRLFMVLSVIGEPALAGRFRALRFLMIVPAFSLGAHIGNNWADKSQGPGLMGGVQILIANPVTGIIVGVFFLAMIISAYFYIRSWFGRGVSA